MTAERAPTAIEREPDGSTTEYEDIPVGGDRIERLLRELLTAHWDRLTLGPLLEGAAWEIRFSAPPRLTTLDGYLTADTGAWHVHLCLTDPPGDPALARLRRVARAAFFRSAGGPCVPASYGLRLWNGRGEQMATVLFPNPHFDDASRRLDPPDWTRTALWEDFRARYRG